MSALLQWLHVVTAFVVLAEALNKLERATPCARGLSWHERLMHALKALAWGLLALGAGGALISPALLWLGVSPQDWPLLFALHRPNLGEVLVMAGFAVLIVRTRLREG